MGTDVGNGYWTFEEFCTVVKDGEKADLIDGAIYMASPDSMDTNELNAWLLRLLGDFVEENDLGNVYVSRVAFRLSEGVSPEPDVAFVRKDRLKLKRVGYFDGAPDLAVEIVTPDSVKRDYVQKREKYRIAGVHEYWIIDELTEKATFLRLGADGRYHRVKPRKGEFHSEAVPGFVLRPEWLWMDPRPRVWKILMDILAQSAKSKGKK